MSNAPMRDGDELLPFDIPLLMDTTAFYRRNMDDGRMGELVNQKLWGKLACSTYDNAIGETLYADVDTTPEYELLRMESPQINGVEYRLRGKCVFRLPRRSNRIELAVDLHAYPIGSTFITVDGWIGALMDPKHPLLHNVDPEYRNGKFRWGAPHAQEDALPLAPLWQPEVDMTHEEILRGGHDCNGVPALALVRMEDNIHSTLYSGAL